MTHAVIISNAAEKQIKRLDAKIAERARVAIAALAANPRPPGCKKMQAFKDTWRIEVGDNHRVVYVIDDKTVTVEVTRVGKRGDIY